MTTQTTPGEQTASAPSSTRALCVDLDGTLIATDLLWESLVALLRKKPWALLALPAWLWGGKAYFKRQVAERVRLDPRHLPYRTDVLAFLREQQQAGRELVLATAADEEPARAIAQHLGIFSAVVASDGRVNLSGPRKCRALEERFGKGNFSYIGNGFVDLPLWKAANEAILVAPPRRLAARVRSAVPIQATFSGSEGRGRALLSALRVHQWVKNLLIFVPVLLDHRFFDVPILLRTVAAFAAFSLAASGGYILNDVLDVEADRQHATKKRRPFASGTVSLATGVALIPVLFVTALAIALFSLPWLFTALLAGYVVLTAAYSLYLKRVPVLDVLLLAGFYTLRVLAGIAATEVRFSTWLLAFSMFLFLSLAFMKRYAELSKAQKAAGERVARRGYVGADKEWLGSMGGASGYMSVLVLALYVSSDEVTMLYDRPWVLWSICPLLLFWISRMWFRTHRGKLSEDPIVATVRDPISYVLGALVAVILFAAL